jgi:hypothetical protein
MANLITEHRVDDLHYQHEGEQVAAEETVEFGLDGVRYRVDLTHMNAGTLREMLAPYIAVASVEKTGTPRRSRDEMKKLRDWARANGWSLSDKGRIPDDAKRAYERRED